ncbi:MAG: UDP-N-acetylglucosamine 1-carboxyvinyltransferase [bacterium]
MEKFLIKGGKRLNGVVELCGAKNAVLPILVGAILSEEEVVLKNVPVLLKDIKVMLALFEELGVRVIVEGSTVRIFGKNISKWSLPQELTGKIRSSLLLLGLLLAKMGKVRISLPGGCAIGDRRFDLHIDGLRALGCRMDVGDDYVYGEVEKLKGAEIEFYLPTTTGTENIILAACFAEGKTVLKNANTRPEIIDMCRFLNSMGAKITVSNRVIEIEGIDRLSGTEYTIMSGIDEAVTYIIATGVTGGEIIIKNFSLEFIGSDVEYLRKAGIEIFEWGDSVYVSAKREIQPFDMFTAPYPGVNSDMQPLFAALALKAKGESTITDTRFTDRFQYVQELKKFEVDIEAYGNCAVVRGNRKIKGAKVKALDLRGGTASIIVGLIADGETEIENIYQIDRGYEQIEKKLKGLGADIERVEIK